MLLCCFLAPHHTSNQVLSYLFIFALFCFIFYYTCMFFSNYISFFLFLSRMDLFSNPLVSRGTNGLPMIHIKDVEKVLYQYDYFRCPFKSLNVTYHSSLRKKIQDLQKKEITSPLKLGHNPYILSADITKDAEKPVVIFRETKYCKGANGCSPNPNSSMFFFSFLFLSINFLFISFVLCFFFLLFFFLITHV